MTQFSLPQSPALQPASVIPDSFVRPRESTAGKSLGELVTSLAGIRPELNNFLQAGVEQNETNESVQGKRFALRNASISAGDFAQQTAGWSTARILGASQTLGQHAASDYQMEIATALDALAKTGKPASPDDVNAAIQPIRDKYLNAGRGFGTAWSEAFDTYAGHYEAGALANYHAKALDVLGQQTEEAATGDTAAEVTGLLAVPGDFANNFAHWQAQYFDPTHLHSPLSPTQKSAVLVNGFKAAVVHALNTQSFDIADQLINGFQSVEVYPGAKLSETGLGTDALQDMNRQSHFARVAANETDAMARQQKEASARKELLDFTLQQRGLPVDQQQFTVPDDILRHYSEAGLSPEQAQREHTSILQAPKRAEKAENQADVDRLTISATNAISDYRQNPDSGEAFNRMVSTLAGLRNDPGAQGPQAKLFLDSRLAMVNELAKQHNNPMLSESYRQFGNGVRAEVSALDRTLSDVKVANNSDALAALQGKLEKLGVSLDTSGGPQNLRWSLPQLESDAQDAYLSAEHSLGSNSWQDADALTKMREGVLSKFRSQVQSLIPAAKSAVDTTEDPTTKPQPLLGEDGVPTNKLVNSVLSARSTNDDLNPGQPGWAYAASPLAGSVIQNAHPTAGLAAAYLSGLPLEALRDPSWAPPAGQRVLSLGTALIRDQLQSAYASTTDSLLKFEKDNAEVLKTAAENPGQLPDDLKTRATVVQWAKLRETWRSLVNVRGVTPDELKTIPQSWLTGERVPFPSVPIFNTPEEARKGTEEIARMYKLTVPQAQLFYANQLGYISRRAADVKRYTAGLHSNDGLIPYPTGPFQSETGGSPGNAADANSYVPPAFGNVGEPKQQQ